MNLNQILNIILRQLIGRGINAAIRTGMRKMSAPSRGPGPAPAEGGGPRPQMSREELRAMREARRAERQSGN